MSGSLQRIGFRLKQLLYLILALCVFTALGTAYLYKSTNQEFGHLKLLFSSPRVETSWVFHDSVGRPFDRQDFHDAVNGNIRLNEVDPVFLKDVIATEDPQFFQHQGVNWSATITAALDFVFTVLPGRIQSKLKGERARYINNPGGSTLTQQFIKIALKNHRRSVRNKLHEIMLALRLEYWLQEDTPPDMTALMDHKLFILRRYLNHFFVSERISGIKGGAYVFLNKTGAPGELKKLSLNERVLLLALIHRPGIINTGKESSNIKLMNKILVRLKNTGRLPAKSKVTAGKAALSQPGWRKRRRGLRREKIQSAQTTFARSLIKFHRDFNSESEGPRPGVQIINTYRDSGLDKKLNQAFQEHLQNLNRGRTNPCSRTGAFVLLRLLDGAVIAMGDDPCSEFNEALRTRRHIHSTFKPFIYAQALARPDKTPSTVYQDRRFAVTDSLGRTYAPGNNYKIFKGPLTLKSALKFSSNTVSLQLVKELGPSAPANMGKLIFRAHPSEDLSKYFHSEYSIALGTASLTPLQLSAGYLSLLGGGRKRFPRWERDVPNAEKLLPNFPPDSEEQILEKNAAFQVREMLTSVVKYQGTGGRALTYRPQLVLKDMGGKSGSSPADSWFVGFSQDLLLITWLGFRRNSPGEEKNFSAVLLWRELFPLTLEKYAPTALRHPAFLKRKYYCRSTGKPVTKKCKRIQSALFTD